MPNRSVSLVIGAAVVLGGLVGLLFIMGRSPDSSSDGAGGGDAASGRSALSEAPKLKVALLTPGSIADGGWNAIAYKGLKKIGTELGAEITHREVAPSPENIEQNFAMFAQKGYDIVFGHGFEYNAPAVRLGKKYTHTTFIASSGSRSESPNVGYFRFYLEEATYCLGYLAAKMSRSGRLGCVGGKEIPPVKSTFNAFAAGAKAADPNVEVRQVYVGEWSDIPGAKRLTTALIAGGVDFLFHNCNDGFPGVIDAVREQKSKTIYLFGANDDQNAMAPEFILASAVLDVPESFVILAREIQNGEFQGGARQVGMKDGIVWIAYNDKLAAKIPADLKKEVDRIAADIKAGAKTIQVDVLE